MVRTCSLPKDKETAEQWDIDRWENDGGKIASPT
jgi:hypothetical protein